MTIEEIVKELRTRADEFRVFELSMKERGMYAEALTAAARALAFKEAAWLVEQKCKGGGKLHLQDL